MHREAFQDGERAIIAESAQAQQRRSGFGQPTEFADLVTYGSDHVQIPQ
ncbi:hypothetical protein GCM10010193_15740 [Kitasatospora atroaurantiaca]